MPRFLSGYLKLFVSVWVLLATPDANCFSVERPSLPHPGTLGPQPGTLGPQSGTLRRWVNPFVGTGGNPWVCGETFPGATMPRPKWRPLFNGKDLSDWEVSLFGGDGEIRTEGKQVEIGFGLPMSGLRYLGKIPTLDYGIRLEAKRVSGSDFFCGLTFPVRKSHCSLIVGGWGGSVVGLSNIDGMDASQNETTQYLSLKNDQWYRIQIRVTDQKIEVWLDDKQIINQDIRQQEISLRNEMFPTRPLGLATWQTSAEVRNLEIRPLQNEK
jgi:hypothetical protein